jgi:hypothetical protein
MKDTVKTLMALGITVGLSDREGFVKNISEIIQEYQDDPVKAEKWSKAIVDYLQGVRDNVNLQHAMNSVFAEGTLPDKQNIEELTAAIKELSRQLKESK